MERIKEALDRVKAEREAGRADNPDTTPPQQQGEAAALADGGAANSPAARSAAAASTATDAAGATGTAPTGTAAPRTSRQSDTDQQAATTQTPIPQQDAAATAQVNAKRAQLADRPVEPCDPRHLERHRIVSHQKHNPHSGSFDLLRTQVLHKMTRNGWNTIGIVSPAPGAGKTVVAINLALSISQLQDRTAMLLDFDLRRPSVLKYLGLRPAQSLNEVLAGQCDFAEALVNPLLPSLSVAAADRPVANSAELLGSQRLSGLMDEVKGRYPDRIVVVDLPPVLNADDALAVMPNLDCVLLVVGAGMSSKRDLEDTLSHMPATNLLGTVLNKAQGSNEAYNYGY